MMEISTTSNNQGSTVDIIPPATANVDIIIGVLVPIMMIILAILITVVVLFIFYAKYNQQGRMYPDNVPGNEIITGVKN